MPRIIFKGIKESDLKKIAKQMIDKLEEVIECPRDYFVIELENPIFISHSDNSGEYPFINVNMFSRGQEIQDKVAIIISQIINSLGYQVNDIYFTNLSTDNYYENGKHF